jgi:hypothetical protein
MRRMRLVLAALAVVTATGCGSPVRGTQAALPTREPFVGTTVPAATLSCGARSPKLRVWHVPEVVTARRPLTGVRPLGKVRGYRWKGLDGAWVNVGVRCGIRTAGQLAGLVGTATLDMHEGKPAIRWKRGGTYVMWLERPGLAVFVGVSPGLAHETAAIVSGMK